MGRVPTPPSSIVRFEFWGSRAPLAGACLMMMITGTLAEPREPERRAKRRFYEYHSAIRNRGRYGLDWLQRRHSNRRGARTATDCGLRLLVDQGQPVVMALRGGVLDIHGATSCPKGRLQPGDACLIERCRSAIVADEEIKAQICSEGALPPLDQRKSRQTRKTAEARRSRTRHKRGFCARQAGYTLEDLRIPSWDRWRNAGRSLGSRVRRRATGGSSTRRPDLLLSRPLFHD